MKNGLSKWQILENTYEAIIYRETFDIVQCIQDGRRRMTPMGEMPILPSMLFCADCDTKLCQVCYRGWKHDKEHFVCATYRKIKAGCSSHQIRNVVVEELILDGIYRVTAYTKEHEYKFVQKESLLNVDRFLALVRKYTNIQELTAAIIREFVEKIYVYKAEHIDGRQVQLIKIVYNCIGEFDLSTPSEQEKTA